MEDKMLKVKEGEILFIYNTNKFEDKRAFGYVSALKSPKVKERDIYNDPLTMQQLAGLALSMDIDTAGLMDPNFRRESTSGSRREDIGDEEDMLKFMQKNPDSIKTPIIVTAERTYFVRSGYEFIKQDMEEMGVQSQNVSKQEKSS